MAVLGKFHVEVMVDGTPANEYDDDDDETVPAKPNTVIKYVEAISGAGFGFGVRVDPSYEFTDEDCINVRTQVDGKCVGGMMLKQQAFEDDVKRGRFSTLSVTGRHSIEPTGAVLNKFQFANLETRRVPDRTLPIRY